MAIKPDEVYMDFEGKTYEIIGFAYNESWEQDSVVFRNTEDGKMYTRDVYTFLGHYFLASRHLFRCLDAKGLHS